MPDLERRITEELDRLGERPDPDRVMDRVGTRKRRARTTRRLQQVALVVLVLAGIGAGLYGLGHAFGLGSQSESVGNGLGPSPTVHHHHSSPPTTQPTPSPTPSPSSTGTSQIALCSSATSTVKQTSQQGAAGTIRTVWTAANTSSAPCRSFGYPGMDFHSSTGWMNEQVHRGGFPDINGAPASIVVQPGQSLRFISYWSDVTTSGGPCTQFDRVKVTLPDNTVSAVVTASGCVSSGSVDVGPVK
jgi:hypothetical protein